MGFETPEEGYLAKILITAGTKEVPIGKLVCIIVENESDVAAFKDFQDTSNTHETEVQCLGGNLKNCFLKVQQLLQQHNQNQLLQLRLLRHLLLHHQFQHP